MVSRGFEDETMTTLANTFELDAERAAPGMLGLAERGLLPDAWVRAGIRRLCLQRLREEQRGGAEQQSRRLALQVASLRESPLAIHTDAANRQHYELPPEFFARVLGPHRKYSCCFWKPGTSSLEMAERAALEITCERAELRNGQNILELGCGWGSLSLWMAAHYPNASITSVSNFSETSKARCANS
jgi:cyclopropane-fatty-acyl-phospholipid synthase